MSRILADGHVPRMEHNAVIVSDTSGREVLRASSDAGLVLWDPHMPVSKSAVACPMSAVDSLAHARTFILDDPLTYTAARIPAAQARAFQPIRYPRKQPDTSKCPFCIITYSQTPSQG
jgi:hypothetical protein